MTALSRHEVEEALAAYDRSHSGLKNGLTMLTIVEAARAWLEAEMVEVHNTPSGTPFIDAHPSMAPGHYLIIPVSVTRPFIPSGVPAEDDYEANL